MSLVFSQVVRDVVILSVEVECKADFEGIGDCEARASVVALSWASITVRCQ